MRRESGFTLVELMIAVTIGLLLVAGITTLIVQQSATRNEMEKSSRQIENGRYAAQLLRDDIQLAGYIGEFFKPTTIPGALPDPCELDPADLETAFTFHIQGYDAPDPVPAPLSACLPDANHVPGTDILVVRHTDTASIPVASAVANQIYLQTGLDPVTSILTYKLATGTDTSVFNLKNLNGTVARLRKFLVHIYFVSPCNAMSGATCTSSDDNGNPVPTLKRLELGLVGTVAGFNLLPLVEGIENLQLDYGIDSSGDGAPDEYKTTPTALADWADVMTVRVNLLARNNETSARYQDTKTYKLGLAAETTATNDGYKRHVFSQVVRAVNPSGRREE
nr:PilW family protein [Noviherbaspirillum sedimenti]